MLAINKSKPTMSAATYALVNELFDRGVFRKVNPDLLTPDRAELVLTCFDMHRVHDTIGHQRPRNWRSLGRCEAVITA